MPDNPEHQPPKPGEVQPAAWAGAVPERSDGGAGAGMVRILAELSRTLLLLIILFLAVRTYVAEAYMVRGSSMEPTFHNRERLLVSKLTPLLSPIGRGDIVVFVHPDEPDKRLIKRVVGLPGERVGIRDGRVYIDDAPLEEEYVDATHRDFEDEPSVMIPPGHYYVLGDNRLNSRDSRSFQTIPEECIVGRVFLLIYPLGKVRFF